MYNMQDNSLTFNQLLGACSVPARYCLTGAPGVGKTHAFNALRDESDASIMFVAEGFLEERVLHSFYTAQARWICARVELALLTRHVVFDRWLESPIGFSAGGYAGERMPQNILEIALTAIKAIRMQYVIVECCERTRLERLTRRLELGYYDNMPHLFDAERRCTCDVFKSWMRLNALEFVTLMSEAT